MNKESAVEVGIIGLGKMGGNMCRRLIAGGHQVVAYDPDESARERVSDLEASVVDGIASLIAGLSTPRLVWVMVPAGEATETTVALLSDLLEADDILIDGGNSNYRDGMARAEGLAKKGIRFLDVGTSGGIWGAENGYCLMIGGDPDAVARATPVFQTLAPAPDKGWARVGPSGAGHFVKMIHNGIEYGMMQAMAEGFALMNGKTDFHLCLPAIAELWRHGSVVRSWLLDLAAAALEENPPLDGIAPFVPDSGEGRWTVLEAVDQDLSTPVIALSLMERFRSRERDAFSDKLLAALRNQFGGHDIKTR
jgi:6-phosphogluconate dehydrogenase